MTAGDFRIASLGFFALTASVAINLFMLQDNRTTNGIETSALAPRPFEQTVNAALATDLGPQMAPGAALLRVAPPKAAAVESTSNATEIIRGIQRELNARGYEAGPPDGVAGLVTRAAIMAYEHDYGLPLTAIPSQDLLSRIVLGSAVPSPARNAADKIASAEADSVARTVEQQLVTLGYVPGKIDGKVNEQTARAIRAFEIDQKMPETGRISGPLVSRVMRVQAQSAAVQPAKAKAAQR